MIKLNETLGAWLSLILIVVLLAGCGSTPKTPSLEKPIYLKQSDLACLAPETERQILTHNCKADYNKESCEETK